MTATTSTTTASTIRTSTMTRPASLRMTTVVYGLGAAALTSAAAAALHSAGVPLAVGGKMIPLAGFAQMTVLGAIIGGVLLAVLNRRSEAPRRRFLQATVALTALSCIPSVSMPPDAATKASLVALHLLGAMVIVPALVRRAHS